MAHGSDEVSGERIRAHFKGQAVGCRQLGSPFTALFCELMAERLDRASAFGRSIFDWPGDPRADAVSLRAAGACNALARSGRSPALRAVYPPNETQAEPLWLALQAAIAEHDAFLTAYLDSPPQTNEVRRCAVLLGGALVIAKECGLPLDLLEIGSSAGLNLGFERYHYELGSAEWGSGEAPVTIRSQWRGALPPLDAPLSVAARRACDLNPLDPSRIEDRERVLSYIWPDQAERLGTTEAAFDAAAAAPWRVERADAATWVEERLSEEVPAGRARVLMHTIMWQYLPEPTKQRITAAMESAGAAATTERPLYWLRMEADGDSAAVTLRQWPGDIERELGRADYHGRWVEWR